MSSDSTELTFVRCPSCRSLVPALSTRCRMCGAGLDREAEAASESEAAPTESSNGHNPPVEASSAVENPLGEVDPMEETLEDDPLGSYLDSFEEEVEEEEEVAAAEAVPAIASDGDDDVDDVFEEDDDEGDDEEEDDDEAIKELDALLEELKAAEEEEIAEKELAPIKETKAAKPVAKPAPITEKPKPAPKKAAPVKETKVSKKAPAPQEDKKKVIVESGGKKAGESKLSFGKPAKEEVAKPKPSRSVKPAPKKPEPKLKSKPAAKPVPVAASDSAAAHQEKLDGQLMGWLVSYTTPNGESLELREGKFFVTNSSLKPSDLIIEDDSISTPHALVTLNAEIGVQVQDLMSDEGVFIRRDGSEDYELVEDIAVVESGDWVRFGNIEYLLVFLPSI